MATPQEAEQNYQGDLSELASFLQRASRSPTIVVPQAIDEHINATISTSNSGQYKYSIKDISLLSQALENNGRSICSRLSTRAFILLFAILRLAEPCLAVQRALFLLADSFSEDEDGTFSLTQSTVDGSLSPLQRKKRRIGAEILSLCYSAFCNDGLRPEIRRWMGLLSLELLKENEPNAVLLVAKIKEQKGALGHIINSENDNILKLIAGTIIREILARMKTPRKVFWPAGTDVITYQNFPKPTNFQSESRWTRLFMDYAETVKVRDKRIESFSAFVLAAELVGDQGLEFDTKSDRCILITLNKSLTIYIPSTPESFDQYLDIPSSNAHESELFPVKIEIDNHSVDAHKLRIPLATAYSPNSSHNGLGKSFDHLVITFNRASEAKDLMRSWHKIAVNNSKKIRRYPRSSQATEPIDASRSVEDEGTNYSNQGIKKPEVSSKDELNSNENQCMNPFPEKTEAQTFKRSPAAPHPIPDSDMISLGKVFKSQGQTQQLQQAKAPKMSLDNDNESSKKITSTKKSMLGEKSSQHKNLNVSEKLHLSARTQDGGKQVDTKALQEGEENKKPVVKHKFSKKTPRTQPNILSKGSLKTKAAKSTYSSRPVSEKSSIYDVPSSDVDDVDDGSLERKGRAKKKKSQVSNNSAAKKKRARSRKCSFSNRTSLSNSGDEGASNHASDDSEYIPPAKQSSGSRNSKRRRTNSSCNQPKNGRHAVKNGESDSQLTHEKKERNVGPARDAAIQANEMIHDITSNEAASSQQIFGTQEQKFVIPKKSTSGNGIESTVKSRKDHPGTRVAEKSLIPENLHLAGVSKVSKAPAGGRSDVKGPVEKLPNDDPTGRMETTGTQTLQTLQKGRKEKTYENKAPMQASTFPQGQMDSRLDECVDVKAHEVEQSEHFDEAMAFVEDTNTTHNSPSPKMLFSPNKGLALQNLNQKAINSPWRFNTKAAAISTSNFGEKTNPKDPGDKHNAVKAKKSLEHPNTGSIHSRGNFAPSTGPNLVERVHDTTSGLSLSQKHSVLQNTKQHYHRASDRPPRTHAHHDLSPSKEEKSSPMFVKVIKSSSKQAEDELTLQKATRSDPNHGKHDDCVTVSNFSVPSSRHDKESAGKWISKSANPTSSALPKETDIFIDLTNQSDNAYSDDENDADGYLTIREETVERTPELVDTRGASGFNSRLQSPKGVKDKLGQILSTTDKAPPSAPRKVAQGLQGKGKNANSRNSRSLHVDPSKLIDDDWNKKPSIISFDEKGPRNQGRFSLTRPHDKRLQMQVWTVAESEPQHLPPKRKERKTIVAYNGSPIASREKRGAKRPGIDTDEVIKELENTTMLNELPEVPHKTTLFDDQDLPRIKRIRIDSSNHLTRFHSNDAISSSNKKQQPSSPEAPSRILEDMKAHQERNCEYVCLDEGVVKPIKPHDPFNNDQISSKGSPIFLRKLQNAIALSKKTSPKATSHRISNIRPQGQHHSKDTCEELDLDKTLVASAEKIKALGFGTQISSNESLEDETKCLSPETDAETLHLAGIQKWQNSLREDQARTLKHLYEFSNRLLKHLNSKETILEDIIREYERHGLSQISQLKEAHRKKYRDFLVSVQKTKMSMDDALEEAYNSFTERYKQLKARRSGHNYKWVRERQAAQTQALEELETILQQ